MQMAIGLTFPGKLQDEAIICYICKKFTINLKIIEASFSISSGWAILEIEGEEEDLKKTFDYLEAKEIKVQQIQRKKE
ncbi:MAG TPA: NIL domain-containing protein [Candidatus Omnitrophota bacterium]|nr:NIL domain-containing protein [Candidatus Omnitrophota bacterium]